jgi:hypothetical protein
MPQGAVPKQDGLGVPKWHAGSSANFGEVLHSALWQSGISTSSGEAARCFQPCSTSAQSGPGAQPELLSSRINSSEGSEPPFTASRLTIDALKTQVPAPENRDANVQAGQPGATDKIVATDVRKTPDSKPGLKISAIAPNQDAFELPLQTALDPGQSPFDTSARADETTAALSKLSSAQEIEAGRLSNTTARPSQVRNIDLPQPNNTRSSETEAFRIDLRANSDQNGSLVESSALKVKTAIQSAPVSEIAGTSEPKQIQNSPAAKPSGNLVPDKPAAQQSSAAADSDGIKAGPTTQGAQLAKRQVTPASEEEKHSDKDGSDNRPDNDMLKNSIAPSGPPFRSAPGIAKENSNPPESIRPEEMVKVGESSAISPAKEMVVRLQGNAGEVISVRLLDQGGQVQVAVRSSDPFTAAQLRQDLSSLTSSLDRIGWKAEPSVMPVKQTPGLHESARPDSESQTGQKGATPDWQESPARKKYSTPELWDNVLAGQNT